MPDEAEIPVADVLIWLTRAHPDTAATLLTGCALDDNTDAPPAPVTGLDYAGRALLLSGNRRVPLARLRAGVVIDARPGAPLAAAIRDSRSPAEQRDRQNRAELGRTGIDPDRLASTADRDAVLAVVRAAVSGPLPDYSQRHAAYLALRAVPDAALSRAGARLFAALAERKAATRAVPEDLHWRLASLLRTAGQLREAVAASDILLSGALTGTGNRVALALTRAAALLDLFEAGGDPALLTGAEQAAALADRLAPREEEAWNLHHRLKVARRRTP